MLDQQLASRVAAGGTGLADMIAKQLSRYLAPKAAAQAGARVAPTAGPTAAPSPSGTAAATGVRGDNAGVPATTAGSGASTESQQHSFTKSMWQHALGAERATGIPARFIVGQAALESGWGTREIRGADGTQSFNLFGMKAGANWKGRTVDVTTTEYQNGVARKVVEKFRAYGSYGEAFQDWARLIGGSRRYAPVLATGAQNAQAFAYGLQRAGYATDPNYGAKLTRTINSTSAVRGIA
jgi:flagellar protein FlgJ